MMKTMQGNTRFPWLAGRFSAMLEDQYFKPPMPRGRGCLMFRTKPRHLDCAEVSGKRHIVFNSYYLQPAVCKKALALRETGRYHLTFVGCCIRDEQKPELFFDEFYEVDDYHEMYDLLANSSPYAIFSVIQPLINGAVAVEALKRNGVRAIIDINDSLYYMRKDATDAECMLEKNILSAATHLVHKMPHEAVSEIRDAWKFDTPDTLVHSLPVKSLFETCRKLSQGEVPRLVFAGGIVPYRIAVAKGHGNHVMDPVIDTLCSRGIDLTFIVNQNARDMFWDEHDHYTEYQNRFSNFRFVKGVPFFDLPSLLADHHFAIYYENVQRSDYHDNHFAINMATKLFSYMEAGLPVIIHTRADYMRGLSERYGFGLVYDIDHMEDIPDLIRSCDHSRLQRNLDRYRRDHDNSLNGAVLEKVLGTDHVSAQQVQAVNACAGA